jgi:hypothetical protein
MTVINLDEMSGRANRRIRPDLYWASSLAAIKHYFEELYKKDFKSEDVLSALVYMHCVEVKQDGPILTETGWKPRLLKLLTSITPFALPLVVRDQTREEKAYFYGFNQTELQQVRNEFGLNKEVFVPIQGILFHYTYGNNGGHFMVDEFRSQKRPKKRDSLIEMVERLIPHFPDVSPEPAYITYRIKRSFLRVRF